MKVKRRLSVWQKPEDFFFQILSFLWKGHNRRLRGQTIDKTVTIPNQTEPNREKSVIETGIESHTRDHTQYWLRKVEGVESNRL